MEGGARSVIKVMEFHSAVWQVKSNSFLHSNEHTHSNSSGHSIEDHFKTRLEILSRPKVPKIL